MKQQRYSKNNLKVEGSKNVKEKEEITKEKRHPKLQLFVKVLLILTITTCSIIYTDREGIFAPTLTYQQRHVADSYKLYAEKEGIDLLILGNSISGAGINCHMLSNALGINNFCFHSSGSDLKDTYFTLKDALCYCTPKIVVIETFTIGDVMSRSMPGTLKAKNFRLRSNIKEKLLSMPFIFSVEEYAGAWSTTIKNHDFIFRDTLQMTTNKLTKHADKKPKDYFLGDSNINKPGITDSTDAIYEEKGPLIDGEKSNLQDFDKEYINKIDNLCKEKNIKLVFLTLPFYHKHIKNSKEWDKKLSSIITPTKAPWINFQEKYDSTHYTKDFFENAYIVNQHLVYRGATYITHQFASYIRDTLQLDLPDRTKEKHWHDYMYGTEGYFYNFSPREKDTANINLCDHKKIGNLEINNVFYSKQENSNNVFIKFEKGTNLNNRFKLKTLVKGVVKGKEITTVIEFQKLIDFECINYPIYWIGLIKDFEPKEIVAIEGQN